MEQNLTQIYQTLQKLIGLHRQMLDTVRLEREALTAADLKSIQETTFAKEALIAAIRHAETERLKHTTQLALLWKRPLRDLTLQEIIIAIQAKAPQDAEQLRSSFNALTVLVQRIREQNADNFQLVEQSMEHVRNMKKNVLGETVPHSNTYTSQGQRTSAPGNSRFLSKEA